MGQETTANATRVKDTQSRAQAYALLVTVSIIWGLAFVAIRRADFELSPVSLTLLRWLIVSVGFLFLLPFVKSKAKFEGKDLPRLLGIALANVAGYHLSLNTAEISVSAGLAGLVISLGPVFIVVLSTLTLRERVRKNLVYGLVLAVLGALVLSIPDWGAGVSTLSGPLEVVLAALFFAFFTVLSKPLVQKYGPLSVTIWAALLGTIMLLPITPADFIHRVSALSPQGWISVLYLAIPSTVIGYSLFYSLVGRGAVSTLSAQLYLVPVVSIVGGVIINQEQVTLLTLIGGAALLTAVALARMGR